MKRRWRDLTDERAADHFADRESAFKMSIGVHIDVIMNERSRVVQKPHGNLTVSSMPHRNGDRRKTEIGAKRRP
jgi:hypothetical protein